MKIVILTPIPFWHPGTQELIDQLKESGLEVRALDIFNGRRIDRHGVEHNLKPKFLHGIFGKLYLKLFRIRFIDKHIADGDIVDIHFVEPVYGKYIKYIKRKSIKLIATLFGSDLFRTDPAQKKIQSPVFENADRIILSENMVPYFEEHFPSQRQKYCFNQYGSARLDLVNKLNSAENKSKYREKYGIADDKIVISCGYNAKKEQQHLKVLERIDKLSEIDKQNLFLVLSMTYGKDESGQVYINKIKRKLEELNILNVCFEKRLTDQEIAEIRIMSDITINTQTTDALASSIKEAMVAGDIMLVGNWLPYNLYKDLGAFFISTSFEDLTGDLATVLKDIGELRIKSGINRKVILDFASWDVLIKDWINLYKEI